jgi:hypothetical protein
VRQIGSDSGDMVDGNQPSGSFAGCESGIDAEKLGGGYIDPRLWTYL